MKPFSGLNYYDLLEISPTASMEQIRQAYEMAKKTYSHESMATYPLFDAASRDRIMKRIESAYSTLGDEKRRREYDAEIGVRPTRPEARGSVGTSDSDPDRAVPSGPGSEAGRHEPPKPRGPIVIGEDEVNGALLRQIRETQGIPLQEIADNTRINITYLEFIERENFKALPAEVYLKGYLEQYGRYLGADPAIVTRGYLRILAAWKDQHGRK